LNTARKRLERMRANPRGDWRIADVEAVCRSHGIACRPPAGGGSHYAVSHSSQIEILTIPARRPIKPIYIDLLVRFIDAVTRSEA
jgi:1-acyl-sn-glycerol-3-phosphate acyltransferase